MRIVSVLLVITGWLALTGCDRTSVVEHPFHNKHGGGSQLGQSAAPHRWQWPWCHEPRPAQRAVNGAAKEKMTDREIADALWDLRFE